MGDRRHDAGLWASGSGLFALGFWLRALGFWPVPPEARVRSFSVPDLENIALAAKVYSEGRAKGLVEHDARSSRRVTGQKPSPEPKV
jgi:hypothetical protein